MEPALVDVLTCVPFTGRDAAEPWLAAAIVTPICVGAGGVLGARFGEAFVDVVAGREAVARMAAIRPRLGVAIRLRRVAAIAALRLTSRRPRTREARGAAVRR